MSAGVGATSVAPQRRLRADARSRRHPLRREVAPLSRAGLLWHELVGWRGAASGLREGGPSVAAVAAARSDMAALTEAEITTRIAQPISAQALRAPDSGAERLALVMEAIRRETGLTLRDNQIDCALRLLSGDCVELRTGEGKTLAAALAALAAASVGVSVHVVTVNDYLAARDHDLVAPIARRLGLTSGVLLQDQGDSDKRATYDSDVVYGANKTFVFDALRDRREARDRAQDRRPRQMGQAFAILDEADSALIDDATVPMILSEPAAPPPRADLDLFTSLLEFAARMRPGRECVQDARGNRRLTEAGHVELAEAARSWSHPAARDDGLVSLAETALAARHAIRRGVHYICQDGAIVMIDQSTGRLMPDRQWAYGLQQMVELKEGLAPTPETRTVAQMTQQTYFRRYALLAGLTGTARECRGEFWAIYALPVRRIRPHARPQLRDAGLRVFATADRKWQAVADDAIAAARRRAVLIGVNDVAESMALQAVFSARGQEIAVLDALNEAEEAELVARAGTTGRITVATHLAGRGTDIALASDVRAAGGLHVIIATVMASARLERQLYGRAGRQGDPGSYIRMISLEDRALTEGGLRFRGRLARLCLRFGIAPRRVLAWQQAGRDARARRVRRQTLLREQDLARQLGYG